MHNLGRHAFTKRSSCGIEYLCAESAPPRYFAPNLLAIFLITFRLLLGETFQLVMYFSVLFSLLICLSDQVEGHMSNTSAYHVRHRSAETSAIAPMTLTAGHAVQIGNSAQPLQPVDSFLHEGTDTVFALFSVNSPSWTLELAAAAPGLIAADTTFNFPTAPGVLLLKLQAKSFRVEGVVAFESDGVAMDPQMALERDGSILVSAHCMNFLRSSSIPTSTTGLNLACQGVGPVSAHIVRVNARTLALDARIVSVDQDPTVVVGFKIRSMASIDDSRVMVVGSAQKTVTVIDDDGTTWTRNMNPGATSPIMFVVGEGAMGFGLLDETFTLDLNFAGGSSFASVSADSDGGAWVCGVVTTGASDATVPLEGGATLTLALTVPDNGSPKIFALRIGRNSGGMWVAYGGQGMRLSVKNPTDPCVIVGEPGRGAYLLSSTDDIVASGNEGKPSPILNSAAHAFVGDTTPGVVEAYVARLHPTGVVQQLIRLGFNAATTECNRFVAKIDGKGGLWAGMSKVSSAAAVTMRIPPPFGGTIGLPAGPVPLNFLFHVRYDGIVDHFEYVGTAVVVGFAPYPHRNEVVIGYSQPSGASVFGRGGRAQPTFYVSRVEVDPWNYPPAPLSAAAIDAAMQATAPPCAPPSCVRSWVLAASTFPAAKGWMCTYVSNQRRGPYVMTECIEGFAGEGMMLRGSGTFAGGGAGDGVGGITGAYGITVFPYNASRFLVVHDIAGQPYVSIMSLGQTGKGDEVGLFRGTTLGPQGLLSGTLASSYTGRMWTQFSTINNNIMFCFTDQAPEWMFIIYIAPTFPRLAVSTYNAMEYNGDQGQTYVARVYDVAFSARDTALIMTTDGFATSYGPRVMLRAMELDFTVFPFNHQKYVLQRIKLDEVSSYPTEADTPTAEYTALGADAGASMVFSKLNPNLAYVVLQKREGGVDSVVIGRIQFRGGHLTPRWRIVSPHPLSVRNRVPHLSVVQFGEGADQHEMLVVSLWYGVELYDLHLPEEESWSGVSTTPSAFLNATVLDAPAAEEFYNPVYAHCDTPAFCKVVFIKSDSGTELGNGAVMSFIRRGGSKTWQVRGAVSFSTSLTGGNIDMTTTKLPAAAGVKQGQRPPPAILGAPAFPTARPQIFPLGDFLVMWTRLQWWIFGPER